MKILECVQNLSKKAIICGSFCSLQGMSISSALPVNYSFDDANGGCSGTCTYEQWDEGVTLLNGYNLLTSDMYSSTEETLKHMLKSGYEWHQLVIILAIKYLKPLPQVINLGKRTH